MIEGRVSWVPEVGVESYVPKRAQLQSGEREFNRKIMGKLGHGQFMGEQSSFPLPAPFSLSNFPSPLYLSLSLCQKPIWASVCSHLGDHCFIFTLIWKGLKFWLGPTSTSKSTDLTRRQITCLWAVHIWSTHNSHDAHLIHTQFSWHITQHAQLAHMHTHCWHWLESFLYSIGLFMVSFHVC